MGSDFQKSVEGSTARSAGQTVRPEPVAAKAAPVQRGRVLLVDDDPGVRDLCYRLLRREGFDVIQADSETQAVWAWQRNQKTIELLIMDVFIPERSSGIALARRFRQDQPDLPVIVMSGFGVDVVAEEVGDSMEAVYLQKPFHPRELIEAISLLLPPPPAPSQDA